MWHQHTMRRGHIAFCKRGHDVNAPGGEHGNALQAVSERGLDKVVQMLIWPCSAEETALVRWSNLTLFGKCDRGPMSANTMFT
ncbi:hypothetical protein BST61_g9308 [Cercospora zeina]